MLVNKAPPLDRFYVKIEGKPGILIFPACEFLAGVYDPSTEPKITFKHIYTDNKVDSYSKENFLDWLSKRLADWGKLEAYIIHQEGKAPSVEIQNFWKTYNN